LLSHFDGRRRINFRMFAELLVQLLERTVTLVVWNFGGEAVN
jgi:hypothetical protein